MPKINQLVSIFLPDIHFGPGQDNEHIHQTLHTIVYPAIEKIKPDLIVVGGDDSDDRISLNQLAARYYLDFAYTISTRFKNKAGEPCAVRFEAGTESHQKGQLQAFQFLTTNPNLNVRVIEHVCSEEFMGVNILHIPEESVDDKNEYYKDWLYSGKEYGLCFGHGLFDFASGGWGARMERSLKGSPVWSSNDFKCIVGGVFFGHVHKAYNHENFIYYGGSLVRFCQGEDEAKGFLSIYYDRVTHSQRVEFIENPMARLYNTRQFTKREINNPVEIIIKELLEYKNANSIYDLRMMVNKSEFDASKLQILRKYFVDNRALGVRIELKKEDLNEAVGGDNPSTPGSSNEPISKRTVFASKFPEITDPEDWERNTRYFADAAYGVQVNQVQLTQIITKAQRYEKGESV